MATVLIVEDDRVYARTTTNWLVKNGINARYVLSVDNAKEFLDNHDVDLVLSDFRLDNGNGMELLEWMNTHGYRIPFLIMTGYGDIPGAVEAVKKGAVDYLPKPVQTEKVLGIIRKALERKRRDGNTKQRFYTSKSPLALRLQEHIRLVAPVDTLAVLIRGASGTGKEYVARQIHVLSGRSDASFIAVDCGVLPKELAASELFGHVKGAFTGATENKTGMFAAANHGTLFLDEVGNLNAEVQRALLRALQEKRYRPVGGKEEIQTDIRLVAATNEDLEKAIAEGRFREDLFYRLSVFQVHLPPLRERAGDIRLLAKAFVKNFSAQLSRPVTEITPDFLATLELQPWKGNIRELRNVIERSLIVCEGEQLTIADLPLDIQNAHYEQSDEETPGSFELSAMERRHIARVLEYTKGNKTEAARLLKIGLTTLYRKIEEYRI